MGRKIEMKLIPHKQARLVSFSKRRANLFKKANDLCTITGCEIALVVFSQSGRAHSFGQPSVEGVAQRFLNKAQIPVAQPADGSIISELNRAHDELHEELDLVKQRGKKLVEDRRRAQMPFWLEKPIHELSAEQLIEAKESLGKLIENLEKRSEELFQRGSGKRSGIKANVLDLNFPPNDEL